MKKFLVLILTILFGSNIAMAEATYCCSVPENLSSPVARGLTNAMGCNFVAKKVAKSAIIKLLKRHSQGDYDVKIDSYSAIDLKKGKFKSAEVTGKNVNVKGIYISNLKMNTLCDFNWVDYNQKPAVFYTDVPVKFNAEISEDDLNKTLIDLGYIKKITDLNIGGVSFFKIDNVSFKLKNSKLYLIAHMKAPLLLGDKSIKFTFSGKLNIENGKIVLENVQSENLRNIDMGKFLEMMNSLNPFDMPLDIFKGTETTMSVEDVKIVENKICVNGIIVVKRSCNGQTEEEKQ